jgi:hypothetical protein
MSQISNNELSDKIFPVDIFAVKEIGIKSWQDNFFWPVSDREFIGLTQDIDKIFTEYINNEPEEIGNLLLISHKLRLEYWHLFHAISVLDRIKALGMQPLISTASPWYRDLWAGSSIRSPIFKQENISRAREFAPKRFARQARNKARAMVTTLRYNRNPFKFFVSAADKNKAEVHGSVNLIMESYIKSLPYWVSLGDKEDWLSAISANILPKSLGEAIDNIAISLIDDLVSICNKHAITPKSSHIQYLKQLTKNELKNAAEMTSLINKKLSSKHPPHLLMLGIGNHFHRALCIAVRKIGGKVTNFSHGGHIGWYDTPIHAYSEFALSDEFITYTNNSVLLFEKIKDKYKPLRNNAVAIKSIYCDEYSKLLKKYGNWPIPKSIKRVMIIGYPHNPWRKFHASAALSLMQLDVELRVVEALNANGYQVIYKAHPDRINEVSGIFEHTAEFLGGYFEDCWHQADAYIFLGMRTTSFTHALYTNKPVFCFIMDDECYKPFPEVMELLHKRCNFIAAKFDEKNRITFETNELLDALNKKPAQPNMEFLQAYYFSG